MSSQIVITMDDLETEVRLNAALQAAQFTTTMFSSGQRAGNGAAEESAGCDPFDESGQ